MKIHREPAYSAGFHFEGPYSSIQALWQNGASHPKTQFIPGTASSILGGQIVRFLLPSLGGGDTIAPLFIFDLHPPQNRQTDSFMLNNLLETEKSNRNGSMHIQHNSKEKTRDKHFLNWDLLMVLQLIYILFPLNCKYLYHHHIGNQSDFFVIGFCPFFTLISIVARKEKYRHGMPTNLLKYL